ncbi:MAG: ABC transporter transmembrane domain-containing protein, partial [Oscillospiraceae bacterium]
MADVKTTAPRGPAGHGPGAPRGGFQKPKNAGKTIRRLLTYLGKNPLPLLAVLICLLLSVGCNLVGSYLMRPIINNFIYAGGGDFGGLAKGLALLIGVYLLGAAATYAQSKTMLTIAMKGGNQIRRDLFDKLQDLPLSYFDAHSHGELM